MELKTYIYGQLTPLQGNAYNPFLGHHYYFKISKPNENDQRDAAFLHTFIGKYGHLRFRDLIKILPGDVPSPPSGFRWLDQENGTLVGDDHDPRRFNRRVSS